MHELIGTLDVPAIPRDQCTLLTTSADALRQCAAILGGEGAPTPDPTAVEQARHDDLETLHRPLATAFAARDHGGSGDDVADAIRASSQARIVSKATLAVVASTNAMRDVAAAPPDGDRHGPLARAGRVMAAHVRLDSVVFQSSLRSGIGLGLAVAIALGGGLSHAFWVALGTLTALRSNAAGTGSTIVHAVTGTVIGFVVSGVVVTITGNGVLWVLLPVVTFLAAYTPSAVGFTVGQASFTVFVVVLFNLLEPSGWAPGKARVLDIAIGCAVGLVVSIVLWPRGASGALRRDAEAAIAAASGAFAAAARRLFPGDERTDPVATARLRLAAAAAGERADEALGTYLTERGSRLLAPEDAWALVTTGLALRLAADAVDDLPPIAPGERRRVTNGHTFIADADRAAARIGGRATGRAVDVPDSGSTRRAAVVAAIDDLDPADPASVDTAVTIGRFAAWLDRLDALAGRLHVGR